jgi:uncharacterized protein DUF1993
MAASLVFASPLCRPADHRPATQRSGVRDYRETLRAARLFVAAAAWLSGQTPPKHEDNEKTIDELRARIRKTVAFVESVKEVQYAGASERGKIGFDGSSSPAVNLSITTQHHNAFD